MVATARPGTRHNMTPISSQCPEETNGQCAIVGTVQLKRVNSNPTYRRIVDKNEKWLLETPSHTSCDTHSQVCVQDEAINNPASAIVGLWSTEMLFFSPVTFSPVTVNFWPMTLIFDFDLDKPQCQGQRSISSKVIERTRSGPTALADH